MSLRRKTVLIGALLSAFALWPAVHRVVVERYFVSPWRLFGWAMYCVPVYRPEVRFFAVTGDQRTEIEYAADTPEDDLARRRFLAHRREVGTLAGSDDVARVMFRQHPRLDRLIVQVKQLFYRPETSGLREAVFENVYERSGAAHDPPR